MAKQKGEDRRLIYRFFFSCQGKPENYDFMNAGMFTSR